MQFLSSFLITFVNCFLWSIWLVFSHHLSSSSVFLRLFVTPSSHHSCGLPRFPRPFIASFYQIFSVTQVTYQPNFSDRTIFTFPTVDVCRCVSLEIALMLALVLALALRDSDVHTLGDTSAFVKPAGQLYIVTRRGKTTTYTKSSIPALRLTHLFVFHGTMWNFGGLVDNIVPVWRMKEDERGLWKYKEITLKSY